MKLAHGVMPDQEPARAEPERVNTPGSRRLPAYAFAVIALVLLMLTGHASNLHVANKYRQEIYARDIPNIRAQFTGIIDGKYLTDAGIERMTTYSHDLWIPYCFTFEYTFYPGDEHRGAESLWGDNGRILSFFGIFEKTIERSRWIK